MSYSNKSAVKSYRDLIVWQKSKAVVVKIYSLTNSFPEKEKYGLSSQINRSAVSVPSNIAEGFGRHIMTEYIRFLRIAIGSLYELKTQIDIAFDLKYVSENDWNELEELTLEIERMLNSLISSLVKKQQGK